MKQEMLQDCVIPGPGLPGLLGVPDEPRSVVVFAHGTGSSRRSRRNGFVAKRLRQAGIATLLFDLLPPDESACAQRLADLSAQSDHLTSAVGWLRQHPQFGGLPIGLFGSSTGAALALTVAAAPRNAIGAVVSRGGRPDLAAGILPEVRVPTLFVVGGRDTEVLELNRQALDRLGSAKKALNVVPAAGHLFSEPGALEEVAALATDWFRRHLTSIHAAEET